MKKRFRNRSDKKKTGERKFRIGGFGWEMRIGNRWIRAGDRFELKNLKQREAGCE